MRPDAQTIIERLKRAAGVTTDTDLAPVIGVGTSTIPSWRKRGSIPVESVIAACNAVGLAFDPLEGTLTERGEVAIGRYTHGEEGLVSIPLLVDIEAAASAQDDSGFLVDLDDVQYEPSGVNLPPSFIREEYGVSADRVFYMRARGDSMFPTIWPGHRLLCAMTTPAAEVRDGLVYVLRSPGGIMIRRLYIESDGIHIWSDNPSAPRYRVPIAIWGDEYVALAVILESNQRL